MKNSFKVRGATFSLKKNNRAQQMKKVIIMMVRNDPKSIRIGSLVLDGWI
jgi:hypothetical protein